MSPTLADGFLSTVPPGRSRCFIINTSFLVDDAKSSSSGNNNSDDDDDNGSQHVLDTYCVLITVLKCFHVN